MNVKQDRTVVGCNPSVDDTDVREEQQHTLVAQCCPLVSHDT